MLTKNEPFAPGRPPVVPLVAATVRSYVGVARRFLADLAFPIQPGPPPQEAIER